LSALPLAPGEVEIQVISYLDTGWARVFFGDFIDYLASEIDYEVHAGLKQLRRDRRRRLKQVGDLFARGDSDEAIAEAIQRDPRQVRRDRRFLPIRTP
jgi:hypothetical protein